jgi:predicted ATP-grasp superfamily ATP-dependent carboligase
VGLGGVDACVIGDIDLVRALALGGIRSTVMAPTNEPARYSRATVRALEDVDHWTEADALVQRLLEHAQTQAERPVLYCESDGDLLAVSRRRDRVTAAFRLLLAHEQLIEDLLDKERAQQLAERLGLPVPPARALAAHPGEDPEVDVGFPLIVKPLARSSLTRLWAHGKARRVDTPDEWRRFWRKLVEIGEPVLAQRLIDGPESQVESYHAYVDATGSVVAEFTGRKLRTAPREFGFTTAAVTTDAPDVERAGRLVLERLGLTGVAKVDFKRDSSGRLWLFEVNPRFTLWHHVGAVAGVNIPAIVHADLTSSPRPALRRARPGVEWCHPWADRWSRKVAGVSLLRWLPWMLGAEAKSGFAWDDPLPLLRATAVPGVRSKLARTVGAGQRPGGAAT